MWNLEPTDDYSRRPKWFAKKRPRETRAVLDNLDTFVRVLNCGAKVQQAKFGFLHPEPKGVLAVDQRGGGANLKQTRLYVYPDEGCQTLHLLTLGDKQSQEEDIKLTSEDVEAFRDLTVNPKPLPPESALPHVSDAPEATDRGAESPDE